MRLGPELEIPGYGCEDHFLELDTLNHCWEILGNLLSSGCSQQLLCTFGMPLQFRNTLYNCAVVCLDGRIGNLFMAVGFRLVMIRPKMALAENGNYRESRYFTRWATDEVLEY